MRFNIIFSILLGLPLVVFTTTPQDLDIEIVLNILEDYTGAHKDQGGIYLAKTEYTYSDCEKGKECYYSTATWYSVNWPLGNDSWKYTEEWFKKATGIYRYSLYEQSQPRNYQYALYISVVDGGSGFGRTYTFEDQLGDEYSLTVFTDGDHSVDYDSEEPRIKRVKDSRS